MQAVQTIGLDNKAKLTRPKPRTSENNALHHSLFWDSCRTLFRYSPVTERLSLTAKCLAGADFCPDDVARSKEDNFRVRCWHAAQTCSYIHTYIHACIHKCMHTCMHYIPTYLDYLTTYLHMYVYAYVCVRNVYVHKQTYRQTFVHTSICLCMFGCVYISYTCVHSS